MSGSIDPARSLRESIDDLANPENTINVDIGTRGPAVGYERVMDGKRLDVDRVGMGAEVGVHEGRPRGALSMTYYGSLVPSRIMRALYSPEYTMSLRYDHELGKGGAVGGRVGLSNTVAGRVNVGGYVGIDRGVSGERKGSWGSEVGFSTGINF